jgi:hypothetical protein
VLFNQTQAEEALSRAVDVLARPFRAPTNGDHQDLNVALVNSIDDPIALTGRSQAVGSLEFPQERLPWEFGIHGQPVDAIADPLPRAAVRDGNEHGPGRQYQVA